MPGVSDPTKRELGIWLRTTTINPCILFYCFLISMSIKSWSLYCLNFGFAARLFGCRQLSNTQQTSALFHSLGINFNQTHQKSTSSFILWLNIDYIYCGLLWKITIELEAKTVGRLHAIKLQWIYNGLGFTIGMLRLSHFFSFRLLVFYLLLL